MAIVRQEQSVGCTKCTAFGKDNFQEIVVVRLKPPAVGVGSSSTFSIEGRVSQIICRKCGHVMRETALS